MAWYGNIEVLRVRAGLQPADDTKDALLEQAAAATLDLVETYLDRKLELKDDIEYFYVGDKHILVHRWPIVRDSVTILVDDNPVSMTDKLVDYERGIIYRPPTGGKGSESSVEYEGGYDPIPASLLWAMLAAFDSVWYGTPGWGGTPGAGQTTGSGEVKKVTLVGIGSVDLDTGSTSGSASRSGGNTSTAWGILSEDAITILDRYRRESVIGVG